MLNPKLRVLTDKIRDKKLREKVTALLEDPTFEINGKKHPFLPLEVAPAGLSHHHCYAGGYIEHVVSTANIALTLCNNVEKVYHGKVNRDFVIAGILLHDIFKPTLYVATENGSYSLTPLADHLDHLSIVIAELIRRDFPLEVIHAVSAHHGDYGPIRPHTLEALICHLADLIDSRLNGEILSAANYLTRKATGAEILGLTSKEALLIVSSKSNEGWRGVAKAVEKIKKKRKLHKA